MSFMKAREMTARILKGLIFISSAIGIGYLPVWILLGSFNPFIGVEPFPVFEKDVHDFGSVGVAEELSCVFYYKNHGQTPIRIQEVKSSCGCIVPKPTAEFVLPGNRSGPLAVRMSTKGLKTPSELSRKLTIKFISDKGAQSTHAVTVRAQVIGDVEINPPQLKFVRPAIVGSTVSAEIRVRRMLLSVGDFRSIKLRVPVHLAAKEKSNDGETAVFDVSIDPQWQPASGSVELVFQKGMEQNTVPLEVQIVDASHGIAIEPRNYFLVIDQELDPLKIKEISRKVISVGLPTSQHLHLAQIKGDEDTLFWAILTENGGLGIELGLKRIPSGRVYSSIVTLSFQDQKQKTIAEVPISVRVFLKKSLSSN